MTKPINFANFTRDLALDRRLDSLRALLIPAETAAETDFNEESLDSAGAGRQSVPQPDKYDARTRSRLLANMARDLMRAEQLLVPAYNTYRDNILGSVVDRASALVAVSSFSPSISLQLPLTYASLRLLFAALGAQVQRFGVEPPGEWANFVDGSYDPATDDTGTTAE